jgi:hypothetical protein
MRHKPAIATASPVLIAPSRRRFISGKTGISRMSFQKGRGNPKLAHSFSPAANVRFPTVSDRRSGRGERPLSGRSFLIANERKGA